VRPALVGMVVLCVNGALLSCSSKGGGGSGGAGGGGGSAGGTGGGSGGSVGGSDGGMPNTIPIVETALEIASAICPKAYQCCTTAQLEANSFAGMTEQECVASTSESYRDFLQDVQSSQDAHRARYERSKVDACLDTIRTSSCAMLNMTNHLRGVPNCGSLTTPLVATGGVCSQGFECIDGVCQIPQGAIEGVCGTGAGAGQSCATATCAPGLVCDPRDGADETDDVCAQLQADGTACTNPIQCRSGYCAAPAGGGATICTATSQCFYSSPCTAGAGRPTLAALLLAGAMLAAAVVRSRRSRRR
jgi:hypothetical protein